MRRTERIRRVFVSFISPSETACSTTIVRSRIDGPGRRRVLMHPDAWASVRRIG
jgi:hypothetical protein